MNALFYGLELFAPWSDAKSGRLIPVASRHLTLKYLGAVRRPLLHPVPIISLGIGGALQGLIELSNVLAYDFKPLTQSQRLYEIKNLFSTDERKFLPHVSVARKPFCLQEWQNAFIALPAYTKDLHLYESRGNLHYQPIWTYPMHAPFDAIEHAADLAFKIRGKNLDELFSNGFLAIAFRQRGLINYFETPAKLSTLDEVSIALNRVLTRAATSLGVAAKAVRHEGQIHLSVDHFEWEMIVEV